MAGPRRAALVLTALLCCGLLSGDEPRQPVPTSDPLPRYYRKLALDKDQTEKVRKMQAEYQSRIEKLRQQIQALQKEKQEKLEKLLTRDQKARLKDLQAQGPGTFKLSAPRMHLRVHPAKPHTFSVELTHDKAFEGAVRLTYSELPRGVKITPNPHVFKEGGQAIADLTIQAERGVPAGDYYISILATPDEGEPIEVKVPLRLFAQ